MNAALGHPFYNLVVFSLAPEWGFMTRTGAATAEVSFWFLASGLILIAALRLVIYLGIARFLMRQEGPLAYVDVFLENHQWVAPTLFLPFLFSSNLEMNVVGFLLAPILVPWGFFVGLSVFSRNMHAVFNGQGPPEEEV